eukprot:755164-Hanusia_phi.AAC.4
MAASAANFNTDFRILLILSLEMIDRALKRTEIEVRVCPVPAKFLANCQQLSTWRRAAPLRSYSVRLLQSIEREGPWREDVPISMHQEKT